MLAQLVRKACEPLQDLRSLPSGGMLVETTGVANRDSVERSRSSPKYSEKCPLFRSVVINKVKLKSRL
jgi:hypothetical protein